MKREQANKWNHYLPGVVNLSDHQMKLQGSIHKISEPDVPIDGQLIEELGMAYSITFCFMVF